MPHRAPRRLLAIATACTVLAVGCAGTDGIADDAQPREAIMEVASPDIPDGGTVPTVFTCDGEDRRPAIAWTGLPGETVEVIVVVDDPDAPGGTFTHWTAWGIAPGASPLADTLPAGVTEGTNGFGSIGWRGPCPPPGHDPHHYRFRVLALDARVGLRPGASPDELAAAVGDHVLAEGRLTATYGR